jgi:protein-S-isoprenylcysteine O-methyltransferase Ste14
MSAENATLIAWGAFIVSWVAAAFWSDPPAKRAGLGGEWPYRATMILGVVLMFGVTKNVYRETKFEFSAGVEWALFGVVIAGILFAWWARIYLGRLWSSNVTKKADHHVVDTGPYALVRHPIYTGLIAGIFATAVQTGSPAVLVGALLISLGIYMKARLEERFLREQLGADAYDSYRKRVPMLVPFGPR